jgi:hypothetical protein
LPTRVQNAASVSAVHPQTFATPPAPQLLSAGQPRVKLQSATVLLLPQLSGSGPTLPQFLPTRVQNAPSSSGVHEHVFEALHVLGAAHVPHEVTERALPQLSMPLKLPQVLLPWATQNAASVWGMHPQTLGVPPLPHTVFAGQPRVKLQSVTVLSLPQLSLNGPTLPQFLPRRAQNAVSISGVHEQVFEALHALGAVHVPHEVTVLLMPQLSASGPTLPQVLLLAAQNWASFWGTHPQTLSTPPPPHAVFAGQPLPPLQSVTVLSLPQLSLNGPTLSQFLPRRVQKVGLSSGVHVQTLATQFWPVRGHAPRKLQSTRRGPLQMSVRATLPQFLPLVAQRARSVCGVQSQTFGTPPPPQVLGAVQLAPKLQSETER